jgi:hypothetical protein
MSLIVVLILSIGLLLALSTAGYLIYTRNSKKWSNSYYWKPGRDKSANLQTVREEFRLQDQQLKTYKKIIGLLIQGRNLSNKVTSEADSIYKLKADNHEIKKTDLMVLKNQATLVEAMNNDLVKLLEDNQNTGTGRMLENVQALNNQLIYLSETMASLIKADDGLINDIAFLEQVIRKTRKIHDEIGRIHQQYISEFQDYFSKL